MDMFAFLKILTGFAMPPASLAAGVVVALLLAMVGLRRLGRVIVVMAIAETLVMSFPPSVTVPASGVS